MDAATACDGGLAMVAFAFGAGIILNIPGIWYLGALEDISRADDGTAATILWILLFVAIMFMLAEVPLGGYAVSPDGAPVRVTQPEGGLSENGGQSQPEGG